MRQRVFHSAGTIMISSLLLCLMVPFQWIFCLQKRPISNGKHPFGVPNFEKTQANYRGAGLADKALAIGEGRAHRCNEAFATHVVEVMTAILQAGEAGQVMSMTTTCERPEVLGPEQAQSLMV